MAANDTEIRDTDFEAAFAEGEPEPGGMNLEAAEEREEGAADTPTEEAAESAGEVEGAPAAVVVIAQASPEGEVKPSAEVPDTPTEGEEEAAEQGGVKPAVAATDDPLDLSDVPAEDLQKAKSWAGRLKKMEADLRAREAALKQPAVEAAPEQGATALDQAAEHAAASGDTEQAAAAADLAQQVRDGELSAEEAQKILSEDFGDEFVRMVSAVAKGAMGKQPAAASDELAQAKAELEALRNQATRDHFEAIAEAHPDFVQVYEDPAFRKWATENKKDAVVENGSARAINKMLDQYKKAAKPAPQEQAAPAAAAPAAKAPPARVDQTALDAAEGVRGGGVRLPEKPQRAEDDYASAWEKF